MEVNRIVSTARAWIGTPYHHQGSTKHAGTDCLGLVRGVYRELYGHEPEQPPAYTFSWGDYDSRELMIEAAARHLTVRVLAEGKQTLYNAETLWREGDVLLFRARANAVAKHCGIVTGRDSMVHSYSGFGVVETSIGIWGKRVAGLFSFPET